jgi:hypothetical protein
VGNKKTLDDVESIFDRMGHVVIREQKPQQCDYCGKIDELRPYGKNGACICFTCGMLDEEEAVRQFKKRIDS